VRGCGWLGGGAETWTASVRGEGARRVRDLVFAQRFARSRSGPFRTIRVEHRRSPFQDT
jgi:hypothetical protein